MLMKRDEEVRRLAAEMVEHLQKDGYAVDEEQVWHFCERVFLIGYIHGRQGAKMDIDSLASMFKRDSGEIH